MLNQPDHSNVSPEILEQEKHQLKMLYRAYMHSDRPGPRPSKEYSRIALQDGVRAAIVKNPKSDDLVSQAARYYSAVTNDPLSTMDMLIDVMKDVVPNARGCIWQVVDNYIQQVAPHSGDMVTGYCDYLLRDGDTQRGLKFVHAVATTDSQNAGAYYYMGQFLEMRNEKERAEVAYSACLKREPDHVKALAAIAMIEIAKGQYELAQRRAARCADLGMDKAEVAYIKGRASFMKGYMRETADTLAPFVSIEKNLVLFLASSEADHPMRETIEKGLDATALHGALLMAQHERRRQQGVSERLQQNILGHGISRFNNAFGRRRARSPASIMHKI